MSDGEVIYLDHHAHAPMDPRVAAVLADAWTRLDANPASTHRPGDAARAAMEDARSQVARLLGAEPAEIVFTSGATEANNIVLAGYGPRPGVAGDRVIVGAGEHHSVIEPARARAGGCSMAPLTADGVVDLGALDRMLADGAGLVSLAAANHEIGTLQPLADVSAMCERHGALLHSDLAQAAGKVPVDLAGVDYASVSAHKLGGPTGVGALYVRRRLRRHLRPAFLGGGQEGGLRPGTVPVALCVAFGEACRIAAEEMRADGHRVRVLRDRLLAALEAVGGLAVNGGGERLPGNLNVSFEGVDGEALTMRLRDAVAVSTGSACTSHSLEPSHVLEAIGLPTGRAREAVRFGLGRSTTLADVDAAAAHVTAAVLTLRAAGRRRAA